MIALLARSSLLLVSRLVHAPLAAFACPGGDDDVAVIGVHDDSARLNRVLGHRVAELRPALEVSKRPAMSLIVSPLVGRLRAVVELLRAMSILGHSS